MFGFLFGNNEEPKVVNVTRCAGWDENMNWGDRITEYSDGSYKHDTTDDVLIGRGEWHDSPSANRDHDPGIITEEKRGWFW